MIISVINHTSGLLNDSAVQTAIRAINRQIREDFAPYWDISATLRLEGKTSSGVQMPLGEREQAFASLEKAYAAHDPNLQYLGVEPAFDSLRSDPRFQDLVRRVGL